MTCDGRGRSGETSPACRSAGAAFLPPEVQVLLSNGCVGGEERDAKKTEKSLLKIWKNQESFVPLQRNKGALAQLLQHLFKK